MKSLISKWTKMPAPAKSAFAFVVTSFILKGINLITTPVFTRVMSAEQYGVLSTYNSWLFIFEVFALVGMTSAGVFNVGLNEYKECRDSFISSVLFLCNIITVIFFVIVFLIQHFVKNDLFLPFSQLLLMFFWFIFSPAQVFWVTRQKYEYKYKLASCVIIFSTTFSQLVSFFFVRKFDGIYVAEIKLWSQYIVLVLFTLPIYVHIYVKGKKVIDFFCWKYIITFALPLIPHYLSQHVMSSADKIMIAEMVSSADAGIYSVVNNIGLVATIIWNAVNSSLIAFVFDNLNNRKYNSINDVVTAILICYGVVCAGVALVAPDVMRILAPKEYYSGIYAVPPIICVAYLSALYNIYSNIEFYHKKANYIAISTTIATITNVVLNILIIPTLSYVGASYTTLISYVVLVLLHFWGYKRCQKETVYNSKILFLISAFCIAFCLLCNIVYISDILRYLFVVCFLIVGVWKRKSILCIISNLKNR